MSQFPVSIDDCITHDHEKSTSDCSPFLSAGGSSTAKTVICIIWVPKSAASTIEKYHIPILVALQYNSPISQSNDNQVGITHPIAHGLISSRYDHPPPWLFSCILQGDIFTVSFIFNVSITLVTLAPIVSPTYPLVTYIFPLVVNGEKSDAFVMDTNDANIENANSSFFIKMKD